ncbi:interleukin-8-like [Callorhinchus milii]|uniref:interleukin-8-like n=1 Tax=Callorhinchus milii TaxID=7868 RepID=UPI0004573FDD|nr:interleukin-8-like [Callorhinchus milii]|eukprot:gi/632972137/ref/XP_007902512.1/ PREDICTED: interleukin-8-like [Callorhinchus milii]
MNSKVTITILAFLILYVTSTQGASLRGKGANLQCQCIKPSSDFIRPTRMKEIDIIPSGPHCGNVEIIKHYYFKMSQRPSQGDCTIVTLTNTKQVCLHPKAPWVQRIINKITNSSKTHKAEEQANV